MPRLPRRVVLVIVDVLTVDIGTPALRPSLGPHRLDRAAIRTVHLRKGVGGVEIHRCGRFEGRREYLALGRVLLALALILEGRVEGLIPFLRGLSVGPGRFGRREGAERRDGIGFECRA